MHISEGPKNNPHGFHVKAGGSYDYARPGWDRPTRVTIESGEGDFAGELLVRFNPGYYPTRLKDIPADATFTDVTG